MHPTVDSGASALSFPRMSATPHLRDLELALAALPENVVGQIVFGRLVTQPRPASPHAFSTTRIARGIGAPFEDGVDGPGGWFFVFEPEIQFGPHVLVPDIAGWRVETMPEYPKVARFHVVPDWVCEVLSPSTEDIDRHEKALIYGACGVGHLWLVDPLARTIEASRNVRGRWEGASVVRGVESMRIEPFEAVELPVARWFLP